MENTVTEAAKHTPGPWQITRAKGLPHAIVAPHPEIGTIPVATVVIANDHEANANLLAAAPDLLEMLKVAQLWLDVDGRFDMRGINAAIAKATGA
jgi:hypothetical protein